MYTFRGLWWSAQDLIDVRSENLYQNRTISINSSAARYGYIFLILCCLLEQSLFDSCFRPTIKLFTVCLRLDIMPLGVSNQMQKLIPGYAIITGHSVFRFWMSRFEFAFISGVQIPGYHYII